MTASRRRSGGRTTPKGTNPPAKKSRAKKASSGRPPADRQARQQDKPGKQNAQPRASRPISHHRGNR